MLAVRFFQAWRDGRLDGSRARYLAACVAEYELQATDTLRKLRLDNVKFLTDRLALLTLSHEQE